VLKSNSTRFAAALLAALASVVAGPTAAPLRHPNIMISTGLLPTEGRRP